MRFGKHEGKTSAKVYNKHRYYVVWVLGLKALTGPMLDLQLYFVARKGRPLSTPCPESKPIFIGLEIWEHVMDPHNIDECHGNALTQPPTKPEFEMTTKVPMTP